MTIDELIAREEIHDVLKRLARGTDRLDPEMIVSCYHPDGYDDHNNFRGSPVEFARWVCEVLPGFEATMHCIGAPLIELAGDTAQVNTYCVAHHLMGQGPHAARGDFVLGLRYVDRFERRNGRWLIAKRVCAFDWSYTVPIEGSPNAWFGEDFTLGARDRTDITYRGV